MKKALFTLALLFAGISFVSAQAPKEKIVARYAWDGYIGDNIHFRLELEQNADGFVMGETTYFRKNGKVADIPVFGRFLKLEGGTELVLNEYDKRTECGTFVINLKGSQFTSGTWSYGEKELQLKNVKKTGFSYGKHETFFYPVTGAKMSGEYGFTYKSFRPDLDDFGGHAKITVNGKQLTWDMNQVTPNIAEAKGRSTYNGNVFYGQHANFKFKAMVYRNCLYVVRTNPTAGSVDDWGNNATIEGIYLKH